MYASTFNTTSVAYGQGSSFRPGPRNFPNSGETAQGQPFSRTSAFKYSIAVRTRGSSYIPRRIREERITGASHNAQAHSSLPLPPKCTGTFVGSWKGPCLDWCFITFCTIRFTGASSTFNPSSARNDSLWNDWLAER